MKTFEEQWLIKLKKGLKKINRADIFDKVSDSHHENITWSVDLMNVLNKELSEDQVKEVMCGCACLAPKDFLKTLRGEFEKSKNLKKVHNLLQEYFIEFIVTYKNLNEQQIKYIIDHNMGMAGKLAENTIIAVKIPKEFHEYFQTDDIDKKHFHYCHCPRIRDTFLKNRELVNKNYCYCGAGFYKDIWEFILQKKVKVEIIDSLIQGGDFCKIAIYL